MSRKTCVLLVNGYCDNIHSNIENEVLIFNQYFKNNRLYFKSNMLFCFPK